jgi:hypothetical protein
MQSSDLINKRNPPCSPLLGVSAANKRPFARMFLDITKAYDRVHTGILFEKLLADPKLFTVGSPIAHFAVKFQGCLNPFSVISYCIPLDSPIRVFIFQFFINDILLDSQIFSSWKTVTSSQTATPPGALQSKL